MHSVPQHVWAHAIGCVDVVGLFYDNDSYKSGLESKLFLEKQRSSHISLTFQQDVNKQSHPKTKVVQIYTLDKKKAQQVLQRVTDNLL